MYTKCNYAIAIVHIFTVNRKGIYFLKLHIIKQHIVWVLGVQRKNDTFFIFPHPMSCYKWRESAAICYERVYCGAGWQRSIGVRCV